MRNTLLALTFVLIAPSAARAKAPSSADAGPDPSQPLSMRGTGTVHRRDPVVLPPAPAGDLDRGPIRRVIQQHRGEIAACYQAARSEVGAHLHGTLAVRFRLDGRGAVTTAEVVDSTMRSRLLGACLVARWKRWMFPVVGHGVAVTIVYPLKFVPPKLTRPGSSSRSPSR